MAPAKTELVIFDLDGTLVDSRRDIARAINHGLVSVGVCALSNGETERHIGRPLFDIFFDLIGDGDDERAEAACDAYRSFFFEHCADESRLYDGVKQTLQQLAGKVPLAIATTKRSYMAKRVVELMDIAPLFGLVQGTDDFPPKPDPFIINHVLQHFKVAAEQAWMVGDTISDIKAGHNAGVRTAAVTFGIGEKQALALQQPDVILEAMNELPGHLDL